MRTSYLVVIPLYNHAASVAGVIRDVLALLETCPDYSDYPDCPCKSGSSDRSGSYGCSSSQSHPDNRGSRASSGSPFGSGSSDSLEPGVSANYRLLVVDDGSTDGGGELVASLISELDTAGAALQQEAAGSGSGSVMLLRHERNRGKGEAILSAANWAAERGFTHLITLDADGQHKAADIPAMLRQSQARPQAIVVGARDFSVSNVPGASKFGRSFSGFWMRVQTGQSVSDMQSGFRVYPVSILRGLKFAEKRFAFEMEVLVKAAWSGFEIVSLPIQVYYPPREQRVSHFRKFYDNFRITLMNTKLTVRALIPLPFIRREHDAEGKISILRPLESLRRLLLQDNTPFNLAASTFAAVLINILPLVGLQSIVTLLAIGWFRLNRLWTLTVHHALWPPLIIPVCVEGGHLLLHGRLLTEISWATIAGEAHLRLLEWILGGIVFGPMLALLFGGVVYLAAARIRSGLRAMAQVAPGVGGSDA
ncbi:glycosyltransferase family 2 protein [Desulfovibrio sp. OttesenSCG-928-C06]|nr:glycosyltransferase family 2 protein [Desulfovibrio sp. OttesenSCG-928-C06]